jgi:hypothetical protein
MKMCIFIFEYNIYNIIYKSKEQIFLLSLFKKDLLNKIIIG